MSTWSCVKSHHKHGHDLVFFLPLILHHEERNARIWNEVLPNNHRLRAARTSIPSGDNSCYASRRLAAGDGGGAATPPWTKRADRRCAETVCLRTFLRRRVVFPRRWRRRRGPLLRIGRWNLLPVQQRGSVRLFYHGGGGVSVRFRGLGGVKMIDKSVPSSVIEKSKHTGGTGSWSPAAYWLFLCVLVIVSHPLTAALPPQTHCFDDVLLPPTCLFSYFPLQPSFSHNNLLFLVPLPYLAFDNII